MSFPIDNLLVEVLSPEQDAFVIGRSLVGDDLSITGASLSWVEYLAKGNTLTMNRGGAQSGSKTALDVGLLNIRLVNAGDPFNDVAIKPNSLIRVSASDPTSIPAIVAGGSGNVFCGTIQDVLMNYDQKGN